MASIAGNFPEPRITLGAMAWVRVGDNHRERSLCVLSRKNEDTGQVYGYSSLGLEVNTTVLLVEPGWASVKRSDATFPIRIVPRFKSVKQQQFLDLEEDEPFSGEVTEIFVPTISDEFRIYTTRMSHPYLLAVSQGATLSISVDKEVIPAFAVSINDGTSLILEFDLLKYIAAERKRIISSTVFGDMKLVQEIVSADETASPRFICTGKHYVLRASKRQLTCNECFVGSDVSEKSINEIACLQYLRNNCQREKAHEHVAEIREAFATRHYVFTVSKYLGGCSVAELKQAKPDISEEVVKTIARDILSALMMLHKNGILHGAVSPTNLMIQLRKQGKPSFALSELGLAKYVSSSCDECCDMKFEKSRGNYASLFSSDIYSMAVSMLFLFTGLDLPRTAITEAVAYNSLGILPTWRPKVPLKAIASPLALSLMTQMLILDPAETPCTADQLLDHPWFYASPSSRIRDHPPAIVFNDFTKSTENIIP